MANASASVASQSVSIVRKAFSPQAVTIDTTIADSTTIDLRFAAGGVIKCTSIASVTFTWYACDTDNGTFLPIYFGGAAVVTTVPGGTNCFVEIPDACWAYPYVRILPNADDAETVTVILKS